jgi:hypothetical protein
MHLHYEDRSVAAILEATPSRAPLPRTPLDDLAGRDWVSGEWLVDGDGVVTHLYPVVRWGLPWSGGEVPVVEREVVQRMCHDFRGMKDLDLWRMDGDDLLVTFYLGAEPGDDDEETARISPDENGHYVLDLGYTFWRVRPEHHWQMAARAYLRGC